jgi:hypothetical protein
MSTKVRKIAGTVADPTLPKTPITIDGKTYNLCFDLGALAEAEMAINAELAKAGVMDRVSLLLELPSQTLGSMRKIFAAAVRKFHPELGFDEAMRLIKMPDLYTVALAVQEAWKAAMPARESADPLAPSE